MAAPVIGLLLLPDQQAATGRGDKAKRAHVFS
jgi:hypothetical protein